MTRSAVLARRNGHMSPSTWTGDTVRKEELPVDLQERCATAGGGRDRRSRSQSSLSRLLKPPAHGEARVMSEIDASPATGKEGRTAFGDCCGAPRIGDMTYP